MTYEKQPTQITQIKLGETPLHTQKRKCLNVEQGLRERKGGARKMKFRYVMSYMKRNIALAFLLMLIGLVQITFGQTIHQTQNKADQTLRSNGRINPSTLGMEFSIPLGGFLGRANNDKSVTLEYSSKVWGTYMPDTWETNLGTIYTNIRPQFGKDSVRGWTTSLGIPRIEFPTDQYYTEGTEGKLYGGAPGVTTYYIKRVKIIMPDGSAHEMRQDDSIYSFGGSFDWQGTYLSVDGSKMRLEINSTQNVLYFPDGGRFLFNSNYVVSSFVDRHGNKMSYDSNSKQWTDTLGRVLSNPLPFAEYGGIGTHPEEGTQTYQFPGFNGQNQQVQFVWAKLSTQQSSPAYTTDRFCLSFQQKNLPSGAAVLFSTPGSETLACDPSTTPFDPVLLTEIHLQNGSVYKFHYNLYAEIDKIEYPTGGYERFEYGEIPPLQSVNNGAYDQFNRGVKKRWISSDGTANSEVLWQYGVTRENPYLTNGLYKIRTTAPDGTYSEQFLFDESFDSPYGFSNIAIGHPYEERAYSASGQLLRRKLTKYTKTGPLPGGYSGASRNLRPIKDVSIIFESNTSSALASMSETTYDSNSNPDYFAELNPTQSKTYNFITLDLNTAQSSNIDQISTLFGSNQLANISEIDYLYNEYYKARNISALPLETRVKDASGVVKAKSQISYDALSIISAGTDIQWIDPQTNIRGDVTSTKTWTDIANNQYIETAAQYDNFGNVRKDWDAKGNLSETEYTSTYKYAYPTKLTTPVPDSTGANGSSTAFETTSTYDLTTGLPLTMTDANGQTTSMEYNDSLLRPTKVIPPSGAGQTVMEYTDTPGAIAVKTKTQIDATNWAESTVYADGLGRAVKSEKKDNGGNVFAETQYDNMGRAFKTSNPYRAGDTIVWTQTAFDDLGRVHTITTPDGAVVQTDYDLATSGTLGSVVTVTDQAGKTRRSITNALGQLARVDEPDDSGNLGTISSPNQATAYSYDTLNNLTTVNQGVQTRTFIYDSLSRLKQAANPESGTISYTYDANGNLTGKTDARSIATAYGYDNLNRVLTRTYSDSTPAVSYYYDGTGLGGVPSYAKGKLTRVSSSVSDTRYNSFDNTGKVLSSQQITGGGTYGFAYSYNLGGMLLEETYPSGRKVRNTIATDASLSKVETQPYGGSYQARADNFSYTAAGAVSSMMLGNSRWENAQFNSRLQPVQLGLGTGATDTSLWKVAYDYGQADNNGNVKSQTITVPSINPLIQTYDYDSLNRLKSAEEKQNNNPTWKQTFQYDRYGNRNFDVANTTTIPTGCSTAQCNPAVDAANNRFTSGQGYTYDLSGNLVIDAQNRSFVYDAENKQKEIKDASNVTIGQYLYDGDGKRVKKISASDTTVFAYDASGKLAAEYLLTSATPQTLTTSYLTSDTLGSPRVITDQSGNVQSRRDFMPFGEEIAGLGNRTSAIGYQIDSTRQKFTGYERDVESDLDFAQARMYANKLGRFTTVDPTMLSVSGFNPQTWNRYAYVTNNPLNYTDPFGLWAISFEAIWKTKKDGSLELDKDGNKILAGYFISAVKTQADDDGARLAEQLGLTGNDATQLANLVGDADTVPLGEMLNSSSYRNGSNNSLLKEISKFFEYVGEKLTDQYNSDKRKSKVNPDSDVANCAGTADTCAGGTNGTLIQPEDFDRTLRNKSIYKPIDEKDLRVRDVISYATNGGKTAVHFTSFMFRTDDGVPLVFSKSGTKGIYEKGSAQEIADRNQPTYGSISGYYRRK